MASRTWTSRPIRNLAGPTLLAVVAILAGSSGLSHGAAAPGLAVVAVAAASLAVFGDDVSGVAQGPSAEPGDCHAAIGIDAVIYGRTEQSRISLHHLVLPPPAA
ncbi:MAG: hypothetical protein VX908_02285 [Planctomycetota bacterium]|nr:hypothetical protein [Planctomycetota bacterium]